MIIVYKYIKTFDFGEDCFMVQIQIIENYKTKISTRAIVYLKLVINFFKDGS